MLYKLIELPSDEPVAFVGVYVLKWGKTDEPTVGFTQANFDEKSSEQSRFFMNEVLGLLDWSDEEEESGIDPLEFVRAEITKMKKAAK